MVNRRGGERDLRHIAKPDSAAGGRIFAFSFGVYALDSPRFALT
jgi:hypothetical protein